MAPEHSRGRCSSWPDKSAWLAQLCGALLLGLAACGRLGFHLLMPDDEDGGLEASPSSDAGLIRRMDAGSTPNVMAGPIHRYSFNGSGTVITDSVGTAHGTALNCRISQGVVSLKRSVTGDYVQLPAGLISGLRAVTFEVWLKWNGGESRQRVFDFGNNTRAGGSGTSFFILEPESGVGMLSAFVNFTSVASDVENDLGASDIAALSQSGMHQIAVTFDGTRLSLHLDGVQKKFTDATARSLSSIDDRNNWLGRSQFGGDPELDAILYEFRIYDRALTSMEIAASFTLGPDAS